MASLLLVACSHVLPSGEGGFGAGIFGTSKPSQAPAINEGPHQLKLKGVNNKNHPLVGKFWSPANQSFVSWQEVVQYFPRGGWVLLGEAAPHSNMALVEDFFIRYLAARGMLGYVVMPMLTVDQEKKLTTVNNKQKILAAELNWNESLWPWRAYQQQIHSALNWSTDLKAGDLSILQKDLLQATQGAVAHYSDAHTDYLSRLIMYENSGSKSETLESISQKKLLTQVDLHLARDQLMAQQLIAYAEPNKVGVLIAPETHVRTDIGVSLWVGEEISLRTILLVPVSDSKEPSDYLTDTFQKQQATQLIFFMPEQP